PWAGESGKSGRKAIGFRPQSAQSPFPQAIRLLEWRCTGSECIRVGSEVDPCAGVMVAAGYGLLRADALEPGVHLGVLARMAAERPGQGDQIGQAFLVAGF